MRIYEGVCSATCSGSSRPRPVDSITCIDCVDRHRSALSPARNPLPQPTRGAPATASCAGPRLTSQHPVHQGTTGCWPCIGVSASPRPVPGGDERQHGRVCAVPVSGCGLAQPQRNGDEPAGRATSSAGTSYFSSSTRSSGQWRSLRMWRSVPWRVKNSRDSRPAPHTRRGIGPSSSMNSARWSSSLRKIRVRSGLADVAQRALAREELAQQPPGAPHTPRHRAQQLHEQRQVVLVPAHG